MSRWPIWMLTCLALCGCQTARPLSDEPCPSPSPCFNPELEDGLLGPGGPRPAVIHAVYRRLWPGCPETIQVRARLRPVVFKAVRPSVTPENDPDPSDWVCDPPEAPLLRARRERDAPRMAWIEDPPAIHHKP